MSSCLQTDCQQPTEKRREELELLVFGGLDPNAHAKLVAHISVCAACAAEHDALLAERKLFADRARASRERTASDLPSFEALFAKARPDLLQPSTEEVRAADAPSAPVVRLRLPKHVSDRVAHGVVALSAAAALFLGVRVRESGMVAPASSSTGHASLHRAPSLHASQTSPATREIRAECDVSSDSPLAVGCADVFVQPGAEQCVDAAECGSANVVVESSCASESTSNNTLDELETAMCVADSSSI